MNDTQTGGATRRASRHDGGVCRVHALDGERLLDRGVALELSVSWNVAVVLVLVRRPAERQRVQCAVSETPAAKPASYAARSATATDVAATS